MGRGRLTREDVKAIFSVIQVDRPSFLQGRSKSQVTAIINLWFESFRGYDADLVKAAAVNYLRHNPYEPKIADVQAEIDRLIDSVDENTVERCIKESWDAICGKRRFDELSDLSKEYWGSQGTIDALGNDEKTMYSVVAGQMQRRIPEMKLRKKARAEMPPQLVETVRGILEGGGHKLIESKTDD